MDQPKSNSRRIVIGAAGAVGALSAVGFPAIVRSQPDAVRLGHLTPLTGFLGPLGEYAVMGVKLAVDEINAAGGVMGRKIELIAEDSVNPQTASTKARAADRARQGRRDRRRDQLGVGTRDRAGRAAQQDLCSSTPAAIRTSCAASRATATCFTPRPPTACTSARPGQALLRDGMVKGKKWYSLTADYAFGHDLLKVAKRFMQANGGTFAADELVPTNVDRFLAVPAEDPQRQAGPGRVQSRRRADHQLHEAVHGIRTAVSGRRVRLRHRGRVGRGQGQRHRHLAAGVGFAGQDAVGAALHRRRSRRSTASRRRTRHGATICRRSTWRRR